MDDATSLPVALAAHAAARPEEPWLFYRRGYDWSWRSWSQVADQVARGADVLRRSAAYERPEAHIAFADRADPDSVALVLAIQAAGCVAVAVDEHGDTSDAGEAIWARADVSENPDAGRTPNELVLPTAPSRLARWTPDLESLRREAPGAGVLFGPDRRQPPQTHHDLWRAARAWEARRGEVEQDRNGRPIVLASASVDAPVRQTLLAWTLLTGAAWVIESPAESFVPAVLRNRPTWVLAPGADAGLLILTMNTRRYRKWHRLRSVGVTDDAPAEIVLEDEWRSLGVPVLRLADQRP